jgi:hypothetical protein
VLSDGGRRSLLAWSVEDQASRCRRLGSPFYAELLFRAAEDVRRRGPCWSVLEDSGLPTALPLRFMASVHGLALDGSAPGLARRYPSLGGDGDATAAWPAFADAVEQHADALRSRLHAPVQTNEVGRCKVLLPGFLFAARATGLPLRLLEIGASAGLILRWDKYCYRVGDDLWGDERSPVVLPTTFTNGLPRLDGSPHVVARRGCDLEPVDPFTAGGRSALLSYIWADRMDRIRLVDQAIEVARRVPVHIERADAIAWLGQELAVPREDVATVVFHTYVSQLMSRGDRRRLGEVIAAAGERASGRSPVGWLRFESDGGKGTLRLTLWPGNRAYRLATSDAHGQTITWFPEPG